MRQPREITQSATDTVRISLLCEDSQGRRGVVGEHGLSMLVETRDARVLFDTGPSSQTVANADSMGIELSGLDAIVLSHGHYDHTGGLAAVLDRTGPVRVVAHPAAFAGRYAARGGGALRYIGPPLTLDQLVMLGTQMDLSEQRVDFGKNLWTTGEVPRDSSRTAPMPALLVEMGGELVPDPFLDDVSLVARAGTQCILITGCAHAGLLNILSHAADPSGNYGVSAIIGGTHLAGASEETVRDTARALFEKRVRVLAPCHCTGKHSFQVLRAEYQGEFMPVVTGDVLEFSREGTLCPTSRNEQ